MINLEIMANYGSIQKEETFKAAVFRDFFSSPKYAYEPNIGNIDFIVTEAKTPKGSIWPRHYLWAESKKGIADIPSMLAQLVLTIKKTYEKGEHLPPPFTACFDTEKIAFVPFHDILPIFSDNDVNWNITPSNHTTDDFQKTKKKVEKLSKKNIVIFNFETDKKEIAGFINNNLVAGNKTAKFQINKNNFVIIYGKWLEKVKKSIAIDWAMVKKSGIIDGDFFLADLLSKDDYTLKDKLFVILMNNQYKFDKKFDEAGFSLYKEVGFNDSLKAHKEFWDRYERPPLEEYWDYIINRRDLLVPQDIRERKGSFFTPRQWVELSQKYIGDVLGNDWQDEYVIWDCAAGTGNLLAGLTNKYNIWASTLDKADVDVIYDRIKNGANLLEDHVFQFDFLNDDFSKLPKVLLDMIKNDKKRQKLVIYINPPYAEAGNKDTIIGTGDNKAKVSTSRVFDDFRGKLGNSTLELSSQFILRVYRDLPDVKLAFFNKVKYISSSNFIKFREYFRADYKKGFVCKANTFDNVKGEFPIGFFIWDLAVKKDFPPISTDVYLSDNEEIFKQGGTKTFFPASKGSLSIDWIRKAFDEKNERIAYLRLHQNDIQNKRAVFITSKPSERDFIKHEAVSVTKNNLIEMAIYCAIRQVIEATWLNDRDNFQYPNNKWETDLEFQSDCLTTVLFDNDIRSAHGTNHWIPFAETEVNARTNFDSHFMTSFISGKIVQNGYSDLFFDSGKKTKPLKFSSEAKAVFKAGKKLWLYYHQQPTANANASLYDIREFFQGRDDSGKMNTKSGDTQYNDLISDLRSAIKTLALKIQPKVYEYGFLLK